MILALCHTPQREIDALHANPESIFAFIENGEASHRDLDKAWHGIHFLLAGEPWGGALPASTLLIGGKPIGDVDLGYGPARALTPDEVRAFHAHVAAISPDAFDARFDAKSLLDGKVYPTIWDRDLNGEPDGRPYLNEYFQILKDFLARAVEQGDGVILYIG
jgi:hypothetical protein